MKHLKKFNEAIINHQSTDIDNFINSLQSDRPMIPFDRVLEVGEANNIEVVDYDTFYAELPERDKPTAPPRHIPFFALVNPTTKRPRLVLHRRPLPKQMLNFIEDVLHHEMIHVGQHATRTIDKSLPNPNDRKSYFSDTDEIMAFSYSLAKEIFNAFNIKTAKEGMDKLIEDYSLRFPKFRLYKDVKDNVDIKILQKYHKYIYLYLEDLLK